MEEKRSGRYPPLTYNVEGPRRVLCMLKGSYYESLTSLELSYSSLQLALGGSEATVAGTLLYLYLQASCLRRSRVPRTPWTPWTRLAASRGTLPIPQRLLYPDFCYFLVPPSSPEIRTPETVASRRSWDRLPPCAMCNRL
jgi:hypothetical protein